MATDQDMLVARIVCKAVLPVIKVMLEDDDATRKRFEGVNATVQFVAKDPAGPVGGYIRFENGEFSTAMEIADNPDLVFSFSSVAKMNAMFAGKPVIPGLRGGLKNFGLLLKMLGILLGLKLLMPNVKPKEPKKALMKVKMTLYMVSTALSQLNKSGDPEMAKWTSKQPERIYQWSCEPGGVACYLKVKAGKTKAGRGYYTRRQPFVHMKFNGVDGAMPVLSNEIDTVQAIGKGYVANEGSPEYGAQIGDFMLRIAAMLTG
jgi:hypothetical protein